MKKSRNPLSLREIQKQVAHCYSTWGKSYFGEYYRSSRAYPPVHLAIVKKELSKHGARSVLDAGCGPASMLRALRGFGRRRYGFDLTPAMVKEAQRVLALQGVPLNHIWRGSVLEPSAYRRPDAEKPGGFESALCFGVLPHVPKKADAKVFSFLQKSVVPGGLVMVEARNELFALFTCNRYSYRFLAERLVRPQDWKSFSPGLRKRSGSLLRRLQRHFRMDLPLVRRGKAGEPGYDEVLSRTHNPLVAACQFAQAGFRDVEVLFYHYHCLPPMYEKTVPNFFRKQSLRMEKPRDWRGHFMASAFILKGTRA